MSTPKSVSKTRINIGKELVRLRNKLLSQIGHTEFRRFIVISRSRTGSTLLMSLLNSHPQIQMEGEVFTMLNGRRYEDILVEKFGRAPFNIKAKGFKLFYYHPQDDHTCGIWEYLQSMDDLYVIHLKRRNILRTLLSRELAGIQDVWSISSNRHPNAQNSMQSVSFKIDELSKGFRQTRAWEKGADKAFENHPLLPIYYEDLSFDRTATFQKVTEFLGVQYKAPKTELKKQSSNSMRDTIANYDELKLAFAGTEWENFFDD